MAVKKNALPEVCHVLKWTLGCLMEDELWEKSSTSTYSHALTLTIFQKHLRVRQWRKAVQFRAACHYQGGKLVGELC